MNEYVHMLKQELVDRKQRRPSYSERAFARDLGISPSFLNLIFREKRSLSPRTSIEILKPLNWPTAKNKKFISSVQDSQLKKVKPRKHKNEHEHNDELLDLETFKFISDVHHFAVLEFIETRAKCSFEDISLYFGLSRVELELILHRLLRLQMVNYPGGLYESIPKKRKLKGIPSDAIKNYHEKCMQVGAKALKEQSFEQREFRGLTFSVDEDKIQEVKKDINQFLNRMTKKYSTTSNQAEIYQLNAQFFSHRGG